jgi:uncharacterized protein DUF6600/FecR-like protein
MTTQRPSTFAFCLVAALLLAAGTAAAQTDNGYGYVRVLEGHATLTQAGTGSRDEAEINQPLLAGDQLDVAPGSYAEIALADRNLLRLDGGSELRLDRLAASPDGNDRATVLRLEQGDLQLIVTTDSLGDEMPRVETPNSTVYVQNFGTYRITADGGDWSEVVVRRGSVEVVTDGGSEVVHADERVLVEGARGAEVEGAGAFDTLERWARRLDEETSGVDLRYVDESLRYQAAPLARYGSWVDYEGVAYWHPTVAAGWRPYWQGRWAYTPLGLSWVSSEPWGWVPYHYGSWDFIPVYGWAWRPGAVFAPAWVYWYFGPTYTGWCPIGYYTHYYGSWLHAPGFRSGVYGWAGGDWGAFARWNFVPAGHFGRRDQARFAVPADQLRGRGEMPRGIITTDTRPVPRAAWKNPGEVMRALRTRPGVAGGDLPDVTPFVGRQPKLPPSVVRTVVAERPDRRLEGTPLAPATLGKRPVDKPGPRPGGGRIVAERGDRDGADRPLQIVRPRARGGDEPPAATRTTARDGRETRIVGRPAPGEPGGLPRPDRPVVSRPTQEGEARSSRPRLERPGRSQVEGSGEGVRPGEGSLRPDRPKIDPAPPARRSEGYPRGDERPLNRGYERPRNRDDERPADRGYRAPESRPEPRPAPPPRVYERPADRGYRAPDVRPDVRPEPRPEPPRFSRPEPVRPPQPPPQQAKPASPPPGNADHPGDKAKRTRPPGDHDGS